MTAIEVQEAIAHGAPAIFPVGAVEQHADYLPLGTDTLAAIAVAEDASRRTSAVVVPPMWWGFSPHHMWLSGTITLRPGTIAAIIEDVCGSLAAHGFRRIVVVNGHRVANLPPLQIGMWNASETGGDVELILVDLQDLGALVSEELNMLPFGHGDESETAHLLHLRSELVHEELIPRRESLDCGDELPIVRLPKRRTPGSLADLGKATTGFASRATPEHGALLHEEMVRQLVRVINHG